MMKMVLLISLLIEFALIKLSVSMMKVIGRHPNSLMINKLVHVFGVPIKLCWYLNLYSILKVMVYNFT